MQDQQDRQPNAEDLDQEPPTQQEETEVLQQAMRREAATREATADPTDQVFDSGNHGSMGPQGRGQGGHSGRS